MNNNAFFNLNFIVALIASLTGNYNLALVIIIAGATTRLAAAIEGK